MVRCRYRLVALQQWYSAYQLVNKLSIIYEYSGVVQRGQLSQDAETIEYSVLYKAGMHSGSAHADPDL